MLYVQCGAFSRDNCSAAAAPSRPKNELPSFQLAGSELAALTYFLATRYRKMRSKAKADATFSCFK